MRWHIRRPHFLLTAIIIVLVLSLWTVTFTRRHHHDVSEIDERTNSDSKQLKESPVSSGPVLDHQSEHKRELQDSANLIGDLPCRINGERTLTCLRDGNDEIYLPFKSFLQKYYEVTGYVERRPDGEEVFYWWHSNAKMQRPTFHIYHPFGVFGSFATYNVENRDRVKCISAIDGVPLSVQWTSKAYRYPIQIAQFALEHYSRNLTEPEPIIFDLIGESKRDTNRKQGRSKSSGLWRIAPDAGPKSHLNFTKNGDTIYFKTDSNLDNPGVYVSLNELNIGRKLFTLRLKLKFAWGSNSSFSISLEKLDTRSFYTLHYIHSNEIVRIGERNEIFYGIGDEESKSNSSGTGQWRIITRNLLTDFSKALNLFSNIKTGQSRTGNGNKRISPIKQRHRVNGDLIRLVALSFRGEGWLNQVSLRTSSHWDHFMDSANWFIENQDNNGAWPTPVRRVLAEGRLKLEAGWYSAMAQGHAMSVLCRAYHSTGHEKYLDAAYRATIPFNINSENGGVRNRFLNTDYTWYEEYPTDPGSFVLNGFIYSLIGLYDLSSCLPGNKTVEKLYKDGLNSLKALLPFFDTGSGSVYDLRHVTLKIAPNVARWDYHSVHVYQLLWMYLIEKDVLFLDTAERWLGYARGERAKHN